MTSLIALEAYLLRAIERVMRIFSTKDTGSLFRIVRAILLLVPNLLAVMTLDRWIIFSPIPLAFELLQIIEGIVLIEFLVGIFAGGIDEFLFFLIVRRFLLFVLGKLDIFII